MKLSIIHATRAGGDPNSPRAPRSTKLAESRFHERFERASGRQDIEIEYVFAVDVDDMASIDMVSRLGGDARVKAEVCTKGTAWGDRFCHCNALNQGAAAATGDILIQADDDILVPERWDSIVGDWLRVAVWGDFSIPRVLGVGDPHFDGGEYSGDGMIGSFIMTRGVYDKWGYFVYPEFDGMCGDMDFTAKCALDDILLDAYQEVYFRHFWHGGMDDGGRDAIHDRHMSKECHERGYSVLTARFHAGLPDIEFDIEDLSDRDDDAGRFGPLIEDWQQANATRFRLEREDRGFSHLGNREHKKGSAQWHYLHGNWRQAQEAIAPLIRKYHHKYCGGRFRFSYGCWLWNECAKLLGESEKDEKDWT